MSRRRRIGAQEGKQALFLSSSADIGIYGGARGGGKSYALLLEPIRHVHNPGFRAIFFRRTSKDLRKPGGLWDTSRSLYPHVGGVPRDALLEWRFPSGAWCKCNHLEHEHDVEDHQGNQYAYIAFDEVTHFSERQFWMLAACNRSTCGVRPYIRATCNPDPDSWVKDFIRWWLDDEGRFAREDRAGVLRYMVRHDDKVHWADSVAELVEIVPDAFPPHIDPSHVALSVTFVPARLDDNPALVHADPSYHAKLMAMPLVERKRFLEGDWAIRDAAGTMFQAGWFAVLEHAPPALRRIRCWDLSGSAKNLSDYTAGVLLAANDHGLYTVEDVRNVKLGPLDTEQLIRSTAERDGRDVEIWIEIEPGASGELLLDQYRRRVLPGYAIHGIKLRGRGDKVTRAKPVSSAAESRLVRLVRGEWNRPFLAQLHAFPDGPKDDMVDALSGAFARLCDAPFAAVSV